MRVRHVHKKEYSAVLSVWEASVRATHHFLSEDYIAVLKPLVLQEYLDKMLLTCVRDKKGHMLGFCGVAKAHIELLFIMPEARGKGIGRSLCQAAMGHQGAVSVDANEENPPAIGFYEHIGFVRYARSPVDGLGRPHPVVHFRLPALFNNRSVMKLGWS